MHTCFNILTAACCLHICCNIFVSLIFFPKFDHYYTQLSSYCVCCVVYFVVCNLYILYVCVKKETKWNKDSRIKYREEKNLFSELNIDKNRRWREKETLSGSWNLLLIFFSVPYQSLTLQFLFHAGEYEDGLAGKTSTPKPSECCYF